MTLSIVHPAAPDRPPVCRQFAAISYPSWPSWPTPCWTALSAPNFAQTGQNGLKRAVLVHIYQRNRAGQPLFYPKGV